MRILRSQSPAVRSAVALGALFACAVWAPRVRASEQSEILYSSGLVEFHQGKYTEALALFDQAVAADSSDVYARYYQGITQGRLGNYEAAATTLRSVMEAKPDLSQGALELGVALVETGEYDDAIRWLTQAQKVPALEADASFYLGIAQLRTGELDGARANFQRAMQQNPDTTLAARYYLGVVEYRSGNYPAAQEQFNWVIQTSPDSAVADEARDFLTKMEEGRVPTLRPYQLFARVGLVYDSNVQLLPSDEAADALVGFTREADGRAEILFGGWYFPYRSERAELSLGYTFYQGLQFQLTDLNLQDHRPQVLFTAHAGPANINILARYDFYLLQTDTFLSQVTALPWVDYEEGNFGRTQGYYRMRYRDFLKSPFNDYLNGFVQDPGMQQLFYLGRPDRFISVGYQFGYYDPGGVTSTKFGYHSNQGNAGIAWSFPYDITGEFAYGFTSRDYRPVTSGGRHDNEHQFAVAIDKYFAQYYVVTLGYFGVINDSNQTTFEYDRNVVSLSVGVRY